MSQLFTERLKSARMMNGLSLQELSERLENRVTRQAIHKYENGEVIPDSEMLNFLCEALGVRPDYFTLVELGSISFRKIEKLPTKEQNSIIERTREILERYIELEEIMGINKPFEQPEMVSSITSEKDVEKAASNVREAWQLCDNPIPNVIELLENKNIKAILLNAGDEFDGLQTWVNGKKIPVIVLNTGRLKSNDRKRSAAKKELGEKRNKISIQELGLIKQQYGISLQALIYRLCDLGIISAYYKSYYYQYIIQMGWKVEEPYKYEGKEISSRFDQLLFRALSEEMISLSKAASLNNMKVSEFRTKTMAVE